jgi:predicted dinucleotide-binding enzyme
VPADQQLPDTSTGYSAPPAWTRGFGRLWRAGIEGTGAEGAGLARRLRDEGVEVIGVDLPNLKARRFQAESDPIDPDLMLVQGDGVGGGAVVKAVNVGDLVGAGLIACPPFCRSPRMLRRCLLIVLDRTVNRAATVSWAGRVGSAGWQR